MIITLNPQSAHLKKTVRIRKSDFIAELIINIKSMIFRKIKRILYKILEKILSYLKTKCSFPKRVSLSTALFKNCKAFAPWKQLFSYTTKKPSFMFRLRQIRDISDRFSLASFKVSSKFSFSFKKFVYFEQNGHCLS